MINDEHRSNKIGNFVKIEVGKVSRRARKTKRDCETTRVRERKR